MKTQIRTTGSLTRWLGRLLLGTTCVLGAGCAALSNPAANGIPVVLLPPELKATPKEGMETIPLQYLRTKPPKHYTLAAGDVLAVFIEGVLGQRGEAPPVNFPEFGDLPPALGFPIPVRADGTLSLPLVEAVKVSGLTLEEAEKKIVDAYSTGPDAVLKKGRERIVVTLIRPRQIRVLVIRQDATSEIRRVPGGRLLTSRLAGGGGGEFLTGGNRRGTGTVVDLPAYQNDVLHALANSGGLPGLDAKNEVYIMRGFADQIDGMDGTVCDAGALMGHSGAETVRIPLRLHPGETPAFHAEDVVLNTGDIVFVEARSSEVFYTAGIMPGGEYPLPRDYDLDVIEAISYVGGPLVNGAVNVSNLSGSIIFPGLGNPSPSLVTVLRKTPDGRRTIPIQVDLREAFRDPRENLIIMPGDTIVLQETFGQAVGRYVKDVVRLQFVGDIFRGSSGFGTANATVP